MNKNIYIYIFIHTCFSTYISIMTNILTDTLTHTSAIMVSRHRAAVAHTQRAAAITAQRCVRINKGVFGKRCSERGVRKRVRKGVRII